jgi:hypothetical protein
MADDLPPKLKKRLENLQADIQLGQITVSFSLEDRDFSGRKKSAFYSVNATRRSSDGWSIEEARLVGCLVSKHVVQTVYRDVVKRGVMSVEAAHSEASAILARYDANIQKMLEKEVEDNGPES